MTMESKQDFASHCEEEIDILNEHHPEAIAYLVHTYGNSPEQLQRRVFGCDAGKDGQRVLCSECNYDERCPVSKFLKD
jgi:hypothetical protein